MANVQPRRPRNIVILCDATKTNGQRDSAKGEPITNIWRLYQAIVAWEGDVVEYFPGVGADSASGLVVWNFVRLVVDLIRKIYMTIAHNYKDGDNISLFGFSSGGYVVRKVASLIGKLGLITDEAEFNEYWNGLLRPPSEHRLPRLPLKPRVVPIHCLGVWHTTGLLRFREFRDECNLLSLLDDDPPEIVQLALHAVAYHENRRPFSAILFNGNSDKQLCKQTLFPGAHSDIGRGTGLRNIIADVTLGWMLRNIPQTIQVVLNEKLESEVPSWYPINSAFHNWPYSIRKFGRPHHHEYLPTMYGLLWHRTLLRLPPPKSPDLPKHTWHRWEYFNSAEEEKIGQPAAEQSPPPGLPPRSADIQSTEPQVPQERRPTLTTRQQAPRLDPDTTDQADFTTGTLDTGLTAGTSLASPDVPPEIRARPSMGTPHADLHHARSEASLVNSKAAKSLKKLGEPSKVTRGLIAPGNNQIAADTTTPALPPAKATPVLSPISSGSSVIPLRTTSEMSAIPGTDREASTNVATRVASFQGEIRAGAVYHIFNKKYGTGVRVPEDAYQADLVGYRRTKNATVGYKWKMEQDMRNATEYRIYNVDFKRYAKLGHSSPDSVQTGRRDDDDDDDWWIIEPVLDEDCFTISHYTDPVYWGLVDKRNRTPITMRKSPSDSANHWEFELVLE